MVGDALQGHRPRLRPVRQRAHPQERPCHQRGQRAKCLECERTFILEPAGLRYVQGFKDRVLAAYQDRMSTRGIRRTFGVCYQTLMRWVGEKSRAAPRLRRHAATQPARRRARTR